MKNEMQVEKFRQDREEGFGRVQKGLEVEGSEGFGNFFKKKRICKESYLFKLNRTQLGLTIQLREASEAPFSISTLAPWLTGLWQPSVHSDVAFRSFDVGSSCH